MNKPSFDIVNSLDNKYIFDLLTYASDNIIIPYHKNLKSSDISTKSRSDDFVTVADKEVEKYLTPKLISIIPNSIVVGEETQTNYTDMQDKINSNKIVWTCDPIDGTFNFVNGDDVFCTMISICYNKVPISAWFNFPMLGIKVMGNVNHFKIISSTFDSFQNLSNYLNNVVKKSYLINNYSTAKNMRCAGMEALLCSLGKVDYIYHKYLTPWDHSPMDILCRSSGCIVKMLNKSSFQINSNGKLLVARQENRWEKISKIVNV